MRRVSLLFALGVALGLAIASYSAQAANSTKLGWPRTYVAALGSPLLRAIVIADAGVPRDNLNADGGAPTSYTFAGGEHVCLEANGAFCFEVIAAGSMTASCQKAVTVPADTERCFFLGVGQTAVSVDSLSGVTYVKMFETQAN